MFALCDFLLTTSSNGLANINTIWNIPDAPHDIENRAQDSWTLNVYIIPISAN
jgi:hypothetical protein